MGTLHIALTDEESRALEELAQEHAVDAATLVRAQVVRLLEAYRGKGVTSDLAEHVRASIQENLGLLKRLAG
jgi:hypothetical protein